MKVGSFKQSGIFVPLCFIAAVLSFVVAPAFADDEPATPEPSSQTALVENADTDPEPIDSVSSTTASSSDPVIPISVDSLIGTSSTSTQHEKQIVGSSTSTEIATSTAEEDTIQNESSVSETETSIEDEIIDYDTIPNQNILHNGEELDLYRQPIQGHFEEYESTVDKSIAPEDTDECMINGWRAFGFYAIGQCIKYVRTGIDSR